MTAQLAQAQEEQRQASEELQAADAALRSIGEERRALQDAAQKIKVSAAVLLVAGRR